MPGRNDSVPGTFKRTGLHRCNCDADCGGYGYFTVAQLEQRGVFPCVCGARLVPDCEPLALHVLPADDSYARDVAAAWELQVSRSARGQTRATGAGHRGRSMGRDLDAPETLAARKAEQQRRAAAHARRGSGLRRGRVQPTTATDPVPF